MSALQNELQHYYLLDTLVIILNCAVFLYTGLASKTVSSLDLIEGGLHEIHQNVPTIWAKLQDRSSLYVKSLHTVIYFSQAPIRRSSWMCQRLREFHTPVTEALDLPNAESAYYYTHRDSYSVRPCAAIASHAVVTPHFVGRTCYTTTPPFQTKKKCFRRVEKPTEKLATQAIQQSCIQQYWMMLKPFARGLRSYFLLCLLLLANNTADKRTKTFTSNTRTVRFTELS